MAAPIQLRLTWFFHQTWSQYHIHRISKLYSIWLETGGPTLNELETFTNQKIQEKCFWWIAVENDPLLPWKLTRKVLQGAVLLCAKFQAILLQTGWPTLNELEIFHSKSEQKNPKLMLCWVAAPNQLRFPWFFHQTWSQHHLHWFSKFYSIWLENWLTDIKWAGNFS